MKKIKNTKGITLIALVITIIILLILAGVTIVTLTGENGILSKASTAKEETKKAEYEENLKLIANALRTDKIMNNWDNKTYLDEIEKEIKKDENFKNSEINRIDNETIIVATKEGYLYKVTENKIEYIGKQGKTELPKLEESKIKFSYNPSPEEMEWTNQKVDVTISTEITEYQVQYSLDGISWNNYHSSISIEKNGSVYARLVNKTYEVICQATGNIVNIDKEEPNGATIEFSNNKTEIEKIITAEVTQSDKGPSGINITKCKWVYLKDSDTEIGTEENKYTGGTFKDNPENIKLTTTIPGNYYLHILTIDKAENKKETIKGPIVVADSSDILKEIAKIEEAGEQTINVTGKTSDSKSEEKNYQLNVTIHKGDLILDGINNVEGLSLTNKVYSVGNTNDAGTETRNAKNTVVLKVEGNLTINQGVYLTAIRNSSNGGGPKGLIVYCTGTLTNNGIITMSERGARAGGENVYLWKNKSTGMYEYVPQYGSVGATTYVTTTTNYQKVEPNESGANGVGRKTAGGASGGAGKVGWNFQARAGNGGQGTSYSGGGRTVEEQQQMSNT